MKVGVLGVKKEEKVQGKHPILAFIALCIVNLIGGYVGSLCDLSRNRNHNHNHAVHANRSTHHRNDTWYNGLVKPW